MSAPEYQLTLNDYLTIIRRRALLILSVFAGLLAIAVVVAVVIPPVYQSTGTIMVESQQIPTDLIPKMSTSFVEERIEVIRQRVITRENLLKIIEKYKLFQDDRFLNFDSKGITVTEKIDEIRKQIAIEPISVAGKSKREQVTIAFRLSFQHRKPEVAHRVANELVTLFLDENVKARTARATETTEFLTQEANKLQVELEKVEAQLAAYKQEHSNALPQHQEMRMNIMSRTEAELKETERDYKAAQEELRFLDLELSAVKAGITPKTGASLSQINNQGAQSLAGLKAEHERLLSLYTEEHPDVRAIKRKIAAMEGSGVAGNTGKEEKPVETSSLEVARVQTKIITTQARVDSLANQIKVLRGKLANYEQQILKSPQVERGLIILVRDHENAQKKYEEIRAKQMNARIAENLEGENKAERFVLLEPPIYPDKPFKPDRLKILLVGFFMAVGGSGGMVFLLETLNKRIRGIEALSVIIRQRPMVAIPYITIKDETLERKRLIKKALILIILAIVVSAILVHVLYMPLDILMMKIIARFS